MNRNRTLLATSMLLATAIALPTAGWAQSQPSPANPPSPIPAQTQAPATPAPVTSSPGSPLGGHPPAAGDHGSLRANIEQGVEEHIRGLHRDLHITAAEEPQWQQFTQVMRDNAQAMSDSLEQRAQQIGSMTAAENMTSYATLAEQRSQDLGKLATAFQALYATFPEQQKKQADELFRRQAEAHTAARGEKHAS